MQKRERRLAGMSLSIISIFRRSLSHDLRCLSTCFIYVDLLIGNDEGVRSPDQAIRSYSATIRADERLFSSRSHSYFQRLPKNCWNLFVFFWSRFFFRLLECFRSINALGRLELRWILSEFRVSWFDGMIWYSCCVWPGSSASFWFEPSFCPPSFFNTVLDGQRDLLGGLCDDLLRKSSKKACQLL